jgi:hypothetical protein
MEIKIIAQLDENVTVMKTICNRVNTGERHPENHNKAEDTLRELL